MNAEQILGLLTGIIFGFLLQKSQAIRFEKQIGAMLFKDMTIFKVMLTAALVGMIGIYIMSDAGMIKLGHKTMNVGAVVIGGALFGVGWATMGFCPSTSIAALGEGRWHVLFAIVGMLIGAAIYAQLYPFFQSTIGAWKNFGKISLADALSITHWVIIPIMWIVVIFLFYLFEKKEI